MATFNDGATHIINQNYPDGEGLDVRDKSTVIIDADVFIPTNKWGTVFLPNIGELELRNAGVNGNVLVFAMNTINNDITSRQASTFKTRGALLEVATGDGTAGQTIDFSSVGTNAVSLDEVTCIWVEKTAGGELVPYTSLGDPTSDNNPMPLAGVSGQEGIGETAFGGVSADYDSGRYFNFNRTTKIATFGDGTNGLVIPNGCKAFISNIQITGVYNATYTSKSTLTALEGGTIDLSYTELTTSIYLYTTSGGDLTINYVSIAPRWRWRGSYGSLTLTNCALVDDPRGTRWDIPNAVFFDSPYSINNQISNFWISTFYNGLGSTSDRGVTGFNLVGCTKFENVWIVQSDKKNNANNASHYCGDITNAQDLELKNVTLVGGHMGINATNCTFTNWRFKGTPFTPAFTTSIQKWREVYGLYLTDANNCKFINFNQISGGVPPYEVWRILSSSYNNEIFGGSWDLNVINSSWVNYFIRDYGTFNTYKNISSSGDCITFLRSEISAISLNVDNVGGVDEASSIPRNSNINLLQSGDIDQQLVTGPSNDLGVFQTKTISGGNDAAMIRIEAGPSINKEFLYEIGNGAYWNQASLIVLNQDGGYAIIGNPNPLRGFTGFRNADSYFRFGNLNFGLANIYFKISKADESLPSSWTQLTTSGTGLYQNLYTELQAAFTALTNYDSDKGINFAMKIEAVGSVPSVASFQYISIPSTYDTSYVAKDASITFGGGNATTKYEIIRDSDNAVLYTFIGTGTHEFFLDTNFNTPVYFKRYTLVNGSYALLLNTQYTTQNLIYGDNGIVPLYTGNEVQVASTDTQAIWQYTDRTLTEGGFTNADRATLDKGLTTGKFLALK